MSYNKPVNIQKSNFRVLILLHLMHVMVKNSRTHCRADTQSCLADSERKKLMTTQTILAHKDAKTDICDYSQVSLVIFCQAQSTDKTTRTDLSTNLSRCHHRSQMCLESTPSICNWVSMMYGWQLFIYWS